MKLTPILTDHLDFIKGVTVGTVGGLFSFADFILPGIRGALLVVTFLYTVWKFRDDFLKSKARKKKEAEQNKK